MDIDRRGPLGQQTRGNGALGVNAGPVV